MRELIRAGLGRGVARADRLHRSPREPRRERVLPQPVRRGGHPHARRRRRMDARRRMGVGRGNRIELDAAAAVPALARPAVLGVHLLLRLQGQQRRIQADGPRAVRPARSTATSITQASDRPQARRQLLAGHAVLQLLPGPDDDEPRVPRAVRRAAAQPGVGHRAAAHGPRGEHPGGDRGGHAARWRATCIARPACGSSCWPAASRSTAWPTAGCCAKGRSTTSGFSRRPATPAARSAPRCSSGTSSSTSRARPHGSDRQKGSLLGPQFRDGGNLRRGSTRLGAVYHRASNEARAARPGRRACSSARRSSAGSRGGWSSARGRSGARSILGDPRSPQHAGDDEPEDQVPRELPAVRAVRARRTRRTDWFELEPGRKARTCCWSRRCATSIASRSAGGGADDGGRPRPAQPREHPAVRRFRRSRTWTTARACRRWTPGATRA